VRRAMAATTSATSSSFGLAPAAAARKALYLIRQALELKLSGVALKDDGGALLPPPE
jgi:ethanolamine ammonia-lyase small subunit